MTTTPARRSPRDRRLLITVFYESPWSRLGSFCMGVRKDCSLRWEIPDNATGWRRPLERIAMWAEKRDRAWIERYALKGVNPPKRWRRGK
jgi:hypothetical protein